MTELKIEGFLVLPSIEDIGKEPTSPYNFSTTGRVHSSKFEQILSYLIEDDGKLHEIIEGHLLESSLSGLNNFQIADFSRHVIIANKNRIDWEIVDNILFKLDERYLPNWKLPNFDFINGFNEIFSTLVRWEINPRALELMKRILSQDILNKVSLNEIKSKLDQDLQFWKIREIFVLFDLLIEFDYSLVTEFSHSQVMDLITSISELILSEINDKKYNIHQRISLVLIFSKIYVHLGQVEVTKAQQLIDKMWREVEKLSDQEMRSYSYLFGAAYSILGYHVFDSQTDFITRRRLLGRLLSNFVLTTDISISEWFNRLVKENVPLQLMNFIVVGYRDLIRILITHSFEFPGGETRESLHQQILDLNASLMNVSEMVLNFKVTEEDKDPLGRLLSERPGGLIDPSELSVLKAYVEAITTKVFFDFNQDQSKTIAKMSQFGCQLTKLLSTEFDGLLYDLNNKLAIGTYPFDLLFRDIESEIEESFSIILSKTFEEKIINQVSGLIEYLLKKNSLSGQIDISDYEILLYFIAEWLQYFQRSELLYNEGLMVIAPIISICFVQIAKGYFEKNLPEKAFLTYINMYYFVELFMNEINRSSSWNVNETQGGKGREDITNRFEQLIAEWNFEELLSIQNIKEIVIGIELSLNQNLEVGGSSTLSGMLEDDVVFGYLDLTRKLQDFIELNVSSKDKTNIAEIIRNSEIYEDADEKSFFKFGKLGSSIRRVNRKELPFPVIRNIHELAVAINMFPLDLSLPETFDKDSRLYQSFKNIFIFKEKSESM